MPTYTIQETTIIDDILNLARKYGIGKTIESASKDNKSITLFYNHWEQSIHIRNGLNDLRDKYGNLKIKWDAKGMSIKVDI
jgi:hypothetical protein